MGDWVEHDERLEDWLDEFHDSMAGHATDWESAQDDLDADDEWDGFGPEPEVWGCC